MSDTDFPTGKKLSQTRISSYFLGCVKKIPLDPPFAKKRRKRKTMPISSVTSVLNTESRQELSFLETSRRKLVAPIFSDDEEDLENDQSTLKENCGGTKTVNKPRVSILLNKPKPLVTPQQNTEVTSTPPKRDTFVLTPPSQRPSTPSNASITPGNFSPAPSNTSITPTNSPITLRNTLPTPSNSSITPSNSSPTSRNSSITPSNSTVILDKESSKQTPNARKTLFNDDTTNIPSTSKVRIIENRVMVPSPPKSSSEKISSPSTSSPKKEVKNESKKVNYETLKVFREFYVNVSKYNHLKSLLSHRDQDMLYNFFSMEKDYQYTCLKLFLWRPIWYNIFKYVETIGLRMHDKDITVMYKFLEEKGFVDTNYMVEDTFKLLTLLKLTDLREISAQFRLPTARGKDDLILRLLKNCKTQVTLTCVKNTEEVLRERIQQRLGHCIKLSNNLLRCLRYIFLLNTFTNSSIVLPQDYFKNVTYFNTVFPTYKVETYHIFYTPQDFSRYADAVDLHRELEEGIEKKNIENIFQICKRAFELLKQANNEDFNISEIHLERFTPNAQYIRIITRGLKHIKRTHFNDVKTWLEYLISQRFCKHKRGDWYCQLSLIYTEYLKDYKMAARVIIKAFKKENEFLTDIQLQELAHRGKLTNRKTYKLPSLFHDEIVARSPPSCDRDWPQEVLDCKSKSQDPGQKRKYVHRCSNGDVEYLNVEELALKHYQTMGYPSGLHCEGGLIIAAFCLLFWDIIYDKYVKGTLVSNVQNAPLDMYTPYFYINRERSIQRRLNEISEKWKVSELETKLFLNWELHSHESSLCNIESVVSKPDHIFNVIMCIGRRIVAKIFERLVKNFKVYHSGFPDLIVWNVEEKKAKFVEVKGENDKLSIKQKLWLNYMMDNGASVEVCRVEPKATKKQFKKHSA